MAVVNTFSLHPDNMHTQRTSNGAYVNREVTENIVVQEHHDQVGVKILKLRWRPARYVQHGHGDPIVRLNGAGTPFVEETPGDGVPPSSPGAGRYFIEYDTGIIRVPDSDVAGTTWYSVTYTALELLLRPEDFALGAPSPEPIPGTSDTRALHKIPLTNATGLLAHPLATPVTFATVPSGNAQLWGTDFGGSAQELRAYAVNGGVETVYWFTVNAEYNSTAGTWSSDNTTKPSFLRVLDDTGEVLYTHAADASPWASSAWSPLSTTVRAAGDNVLTISNGDIDVDAVASPTSGYVRASHGSESDSASLGVDDTLGGWVLVRQAGVVRSGMDVTGVGTRGEVTATKEGHSNDSATMEASDGGTITLKRGGVTKFSVNKLGAVTAAEVSCESLGCTDIQVTAGPSVIAGPLLIEGTATVADGTGAIVYATPRAKLMQIPIYGNFFQDGSSWAPNGINKGYIRSAVHNAVMYVPVAGLTSHALLGAKITKVRVYCKRDDSTAACDVSLVRVPDNAEQAYSADLDVITVGSTGAVGPSGGYIELSVSSHVVVPSEFLYVKIARVDDGGSGAYFSVYGVEIEYTVASVLDQ